MRRMMCGLVAVVVWAGVMAGCDSGDDEGGYGLSGFASTGVNPELGAYAFSAEGRFAVVDDPATGSRAVQFSRDGFRFDLIPIRDGVFGFEHGEIGGTDCPTDGYGIKGHFTTETVAQGEIAYARDCRVTGRGEFTAQR